jgi:hypothetical protein
VAHLRAVPDPDDEPDDGTVELFVDPAAPVDHEAPDEPGNEPGNELGNELGEALEEEPRRYPSTIGGAFYLAILAAAGTALVIATRGDWRPGVQILGGSLLVGALLRLLLATRDAGMLAVRNRFLDAFLLISAGVALIVLAGSIPPQPPA